MKGSNTPYTVPTFGDHSHHQCNTSNVNSLGGNYPSHHSEPLLTTSWLAVPTGVLEFSFPREWGIINVEHQLHHSVIQSNTSKKFISDCHHHNMTPTDLKMFCSCNIRQSTWMNFLPGHGLLSKLSLFSTLV